jgi:surfeit locus 1 family protein
MKPKPSVPNSPATRPGTVRGLPWHWLFAALALIAGAMGAWTLWGRMPSAQPLPTTGGYSGEVIQLNRVVSAADPSSLQHSQVQLVGRFKAEHTVVLKGRNMAGRSGFYVLTPLVERGNTGLAVLVQRGWVPSSTPNLAQRLQHLTPLHDLVIHGRLAIPDLGVASDAAGESGFMRQNLNLSAYASEIGVPMAPLVVLEEPETTTRAQDIQNGLFQRRWPELYPQDKNIARNGWTALAVAMVLAVLSLGVLRRRQSRAHLNSEPDGASTL